MLACKILLQCGMIYDILAKKQHNLGFLMKRLHSGMLCCLILAIFSLYTPAQASTEEKTVYKKASANSEVVVTTNEQGISTLRFGPDGIRQSAVKVGDPYYIDIPYLKTLLTALALTKEHNRILIIGLGGGSLAMFLHKAYPTAHIDAIEIDPVVYEAAKTHLGFKDDNLLQVHIADGRDFIERIKEPYDLIFLDAYDQEKIPEKLTTLEFLQAVRKAVKSTGCVAANIFSPEFNKHYASMLKTFQEAFDEVILLKVVGAGNQILLALPRKEEINQTDFVKKAKAIGDEKAFKFDLGVSLDHPFTRLKDTKNVAPLLRDPK